MADAADIALIRCHFLLASRDEYMSRGAVPRDDFP
jgi:hypothetical protein